MLHVNVSQSSLTSQYSSAKLRLNMGLETSQWKIHSISFVLMLFLTHLLEFAEGSASHISDRKKKKKQKLQGRIPSEARNHTQAGPRAAFQWGYTRAMRQPDSRAVGTVLQNCSLLGQKGGTAQGSSENQGHAQSCPGSMVHNYCCVTWHKRVMCELLNLQGLLALSLPKLPLLAGFS